MRVRVEGGRDTSVRRKNNSSDFMRFFALATPAGFQRRRYPFTRAHTHIHTYVRAAFHVYIILLYYMFSTAACSSA